MTKPTDTDILRRELQRNIAQQEGDAMHEVAKYKRQIEELDTAND